MTNYKLEDAVEMAQNPEPRCACILLLDVSASMSGEPIDQLNAGLKKFQEELVTDDLASKRVELAIITFGSVVKVCQDFIIADEFSAPVLSASGLTPMGEAIIKALGMLRDRKEVYKTNAISYYRPWIFLITDGAPTDEWTDAAQKIRQQEYNKGVAFFAVGVEGADVAILSKISVRKPVKLKGLNFAEMFVWLSKSMQSVSQSKVGDQVALVPPAGWGEV